MKKLFQTSTSIFMLVNYACGSNDTQVLKHESFDLASNEIASSRLEIEVSKLRSSKGQICYALFNNPKGFPSTQESVIKSGCEPIKSDKKPDSSLLVIENLVPSANGYALSLFHDENSNGNLDKKKIIGIEIPAEGFGMSNNPPTRMAPPTWEECVFLPKEGTNQLPITFKYL